MTKKKFRESLDTIVFTSKYVMLNGCPIVYVAHHEDGTWEFWSEELVDESEIMLVTLEQIIKKDLSLFELADLPIESSASRKSPEKEWIIMSKN
jgi:hypothetical protein